MSAEDVELYIETAKESMEDSIEFLQRELLKVRSGKASPDMLSGVMVDYYGSPTALQQVANVKVSDARTIVIAPWEKSMIQPIEQAIHQANLGFNPQDDGEIIRISIPPLTEERRRGLVKRASELIEQAKVSVRNGRREAMDGIKKAVKDGYSEDAGKTSEQEVEALTKKMIARIEEIFEKKEKSIMTI